MYRNITHGTSWVLSERSDDKRVWTRIAHDLDDFLSLLWRSGALSGDRPDDAFVVRCDAETNPSESVGSNRIVAELSAAVQADWYVNFRVVYSLG